MFGNGKTTKSSSDNEDKNKRRENYNDWCLK